MTTISNAPEAAGERTGEGDVSITIKGHTAAQILARGDAKVRELEEVLGTLRQQLEAIEAANREKSEEQERLERHALDLQGKLTQLGGQVAEQGTELRGGLAKVRAEAGELARLREELQGQNEKVSRLQYKVDALAMTVAQIEHRLVESQAAADAAAAASGSGRISGFLTSAADRIKRLNLSVSLWSVAGALAALAAAAGTAAWLGA